MVRHNRKDPGKTPFTNSQDISLGYNFLRPENSFLVPGKAGQFIIQQIQQPKMALKTELSTSSEQEVAFYPRNTTDRLDIMP